MGVGQVSSRRKAQERYKAKRSKGLCAKGICQNPSDSAYCSEHDWNAYTKQ